MTIPNANASYWKKRFLFGLPKVLTKKVQNTLRGKWQGTNPYDELTYGDLISEINKQGLKFAHG